MLKKLGQMIFILLTLSGALFASTTTNYIQYDSAPSESIKKSVSLKIGDIDYMEIGFAAEEPDEEDLSVIKPASNPFPFKLNTTGNNGEGEVYLYCIYGTSAFPDISISISDLTYTSSDGEISTLDLTAYLDDNEENPMTDVSEKRKVFPSSPHQEGYQFGIEKVKISMSTESVLGKKAGIYGGTITVYIGDQG